MRYEELEQKIDNEEYVNECYDIVNASIYADNLGSFQWASLEEKQEIVNLIFDMSKLIERRMLSCAYDFDHISYALLYYTEENEEEDEYIIESYKLLIQELEEETITDAKLDYIISIVERYNDLEQDFIIGDRYLEN